MGEFNMDVELCFVWKYYFIILFPPKWYLGIELARKSRMWFQYSKQILSSKLPLMIVIELS